MGSPISRRAVIKGALAAAATPAVASLASALRPPQKKLVVGTGEHTYEVNHDWLTPPNSIKWGDTHGIAVDAQRRIYIAHTVHPSSVKPDAVCVFDDKGKFVTSWGSEFAGGAHGLDIRKEGSQEYLYHCDTRRRLVVKTDLNGKVIWSQPVPMESGVYADAGRYCPTNVAFLPDGDLFVGDGYGSSYIHRYSKDGDYKATIIGPGSDAGKVREPHGLWVDTRTSTPKLVICDRANNRLQEFTLEGKHLGFVKEGMRRPCHIHYNHGLALVPDLDSVVTILDKDNKVVASLCDGAPSNLRGAPRDQFIPGKFVHPHGANWINERDIVVVEWVPIGRVTLLRRI
jgi:hypothetical protein